MRIALFDQNRLGVVVDGGVVDVTDRLPWPHDPSPLSATWWRLLCRDLGELAPGLADAAKDREARPLDSVTLCAPVLNPSKLVAAASNYSDHVREMHDVQQRTLGQVEPWMMEFDVFLKAPSSVSGPTDPIVLPEQEVAAGREIHHESELAVVIGRGGRDIAAEDAARHIAGYTIGLDITVRSPADRSRRKSYDTFSPLGPWLETDLDPNTLRITLDNNGERRQDVRTADLIVPVPQIVSYASSIMTLNPGDVIFTGAPPGVGPIERGDRLEVAITSIGAMSIRVA